MTHFATARRNFHARLMEDVFRVDARGVATNADKHNSYSCAIALGVATRLGATEGPRLAGQSSGSRFEAEVCTFLQDTFPELDHLRPGAWTIATAQNVDISKFEQYMHLVELERAAREDAALAAALGNDYTIKPDIVVARAPESDERINGPRELVGGDEALLSALRRRNNERPILHASLSCKWTIRSDRSQNSRAEALNLIRNRKGRVPHIAVVTAEPAPSRLASIAIGTGDIDCVYHFALPELQAALDELDYRDASDMLGILVEGKRLRDISDLPMDLAV